MLPMLDIANRQSKIKILLLLKLKSFGIKFISSHQGILLKNKKSITYSNFGENNSEIHFLKVISNC